MERMNKDEFLKELNKKNINLKENQINQFEVFCKELLNYNQHTNLTAITETSEVYLKHFFDSSLLATSINFNEISTMLDIGCGAGFPGIVIKILYPHLKLTLLDSNNKKTKFCQYIVNKLNLKDVEIINERAEIYIDKKREYYDLVTARAVKDLQILTELSIPYVKINGFFIAMKSDCKIELENSLRGITLLGGKYIETKKIENYISLGQREFIIIKKINKTSIKYPRNYSKIVKQPL